MIDLVKEGKINEDYDKNQFIEGLKSIINKFKLSKKEKKTVNLKLYGKSLCMLCKNERVNEVPKTV